jgi:hypothetical protein
MQETKTTHDIQSLPTHRLIALILVVKVIG